MNKYIDANKLKKQITELIAIAKSKDWPIAAHLERVNELIDSLQQEHPKFNVGDLVVSKKNPHLTYRIIATSIPNELGKTDYKVEIFTDGKPGLLGEPHNIHLISSDKIEDWGELVQQEQPEANEVEKALSLQIQAYLTTASDELYAPGKPLYTKEHHEGIHECMKMWQKLHRYYFSTKQEQPEVDLNEEIDRFLKSEESTTYENAGSYKVAVKDLKKIARHFYELGLNARKEENK